MRVFVAGATGAIGRRGKVVSSQPFAPGRAWWSRTLHSGNSLRSSAGQRHDRGGIEYHRRVSAADLNRFT